MVSWDFWLCAHYLSIPSLFQANVYFSSEMLPAPKERKRNTFRSLLQWHKLCFGLPEPCVHSLAVCMTAVAIC